MRSIRERSSSAGSSSGSAWQQVSPGGPSGWARVQASSKPPARARSYVGVPGRAVEVPGHHDRQRGPGRSLEQLPHLARLRLARLRRRGDLEVGRDEAERAAGQCGIHGGPPALERERASRGADLHAVDEVGGARVGDGQIRAREDRRAVGESHAAAGGAGQLDVAVRDDRDAAIGQPAPRELRLEHLEVVGDHGASPRTGLAGPPGGGFLEPDQVRPRWPRSPPRSRSRAPGSPCAAPCPAGRRG